MNRRHETGMALIVFIIIMSVLFLSACATRKTITEHIISHDTTIIAHHDTIIRERVKQHNDTIRESEVVYVTIHLHDSLPPDTIRVETIRDVYHNTTIQDSTGRTTARKDTARATATQAKEKAVKRTKTPRTWEYLIFAAFLAAIWVLINKVK